MKKHSDIKAAAKNDKNDKLDIEVLLDIRDLLKKNNEIAQRGRFNEIRTASRN